MAIPHGPLYQDMPGKNRVWYICVLTPGASHLAQSPFENAKRFLMLRF